MYMLLNVCYLCLEKNWCSVRSFFLLLEWKLSSSVLLLSSTEEAYQSGQGVLVHCQAGVSRSATIVIAYLMKHTLMTMTDAYKYVRSRRPVVSPNLNFMGQLLEFERDLNSGVTPRILMPKLNGVETQVWEGSGIASVKREQDWSGIDEAWREDWKMLLCLAVSALFILWDKRLDGSVV